MPGMMACETGRIESAKLLALDSACPASKRLDRLYFVERKRALRMTDEISGALHHRKTESDRKTRDISG